MDILISFCNTIDTPGYPSLGILDTDTMQFSVLDLPPEVPQTGMLGLAASKEYILIGLQFSSDGADAVDSPPGLLVFDRDTFELISHYKFKLVTDIHSLILSKDEQVLYVVSSGTDEVVSLGLAGSQVVSEEVFWRPEKEGERSDNYHINSIYEWQGDIYVSGFGKRNKNQSWSEIHHGFIYNISKGEEIVSGLEQPHSIYEIGGQLAVCESRDQKIRLIESGTAIKLNGYVRGLCSVSDKLYIGSSARRSKSKSTGKLISKEGVNDSGCTISRVNMDTFQIEEMISLKDYANEIYELLPVEGTDMWPLSSPKNYRWEFENSWKRRVEKATEGIMSVVPEGETIILIEDNTWSNGKPVLPAHDRLFFLENNGLYWGPPADDKTALSELERLIAEKNVRYIAFGWSSFWWFEHYNKFYEYLRSHSTSLLENELVVVYNLNG